MYSKNYAFRAQLFGLKFSNVISMSVKDNESDRIYTFQSISLRMQSRQRYVFEASLKR